MSKSPSQLSFLPDDYLEKKAQRRSNAICAILFIVVITTMFAAFFVSEKKMKQVESKADAVDAAYTEAAKRIDQVKKMQEQQKRMANQAELTASLLDKVPKSFLLAEFTNSLPSGVSLLDFTLDSKRKVSAAPVAKTAFQAKKQASAKKDATPPAPEPVKYDVTMKIVGVAYTDVQVAAFISKLNASPLLSEVNLVITDEHDLNGEKLRKFELEAKLNPSAQVDLTQARDAKPAAETTVELPSE